VSTPEDITMENIPSMNTWINMGIRRYERILYFIIMNMIR